VEDWTAAAHTVSDSLEMSLNGADDADLHLRQM
jgi:hypothetical protein